MMRIVLRIRYIDTVCEVLSFAAAVTGSFAALAILLLHGDLVVVCDAEVLAHDVWNNDLRAAGHIDIRLRCRGCRTAATSV